MRSLPSMEARSMRGLSPQSVQYMYLEGGGERGREGGSGEQGGGGEEHTFIQQCSTKNSLPKKVPKLFLLLASKWREGQANQPS